MRVPSSDPKRRNAARPEAGRAPGRTIVPDLSVGFVLSPRFTLLAFAGFVEALRHAADEADRSRQLYCRWRVLAPSLAPIRASCGVELRPDRTFRAPEAYDYIVVVGGLLPASLEHPPATFDFLRRAAARNLPLIGLCTGSFVLAAAGLMAGRRCAVHFRHRQQLLERHPEAIPVTDESYVVDRGRITCAGGIASIDLATELIVTHCGRARAMKGLYDMMVDQALVAHHTPRRRPCEKAARCGDWRVEQAVALMEQNIAKPWPISRLARQLSTTARQLDRAFAKHVGTAPGAFWRELRLSHAHWLLLNTPRSITQIAYECGFSDAAHFSRWFKRAHGETPYGFRLRRRQVAAS